MSVGGDPKLREAMEQAISRLRDVLSCRVMMDDGGTITEIHVLATCDRSAKQIVRDVETVLSAQLHVTVDHRCISVAQIDTLADLDIAGRIVLASLRSEIAGDEQKVRVQLQAGSHSAEGEAAGVRGVIGESELGATAAVAALQQLIGDRAQLRLSHCRLVDMGRHQIVVVAVSLLANGQVESLLGTVAATAGHWESGAKAVLKASNRRLGIVLDPQVRQAR